MALFSTPTHMQSTFLTIRQSIVFDNVRLAFTSHLFVGVKHVILCGGARRKRRTERSVSARTTERCHMFAPPVHNKAILLQLEPAGTS